MTEIIEEREPTNPLQKLIEGFCSPRKISSAPSFDDELEEDDAHQKYAPDLATQTPRKEVQETPATTSATASPEPDELKPDNTPAEAKPTTSETNTEESPEVVSTGDDKTAEDDDAKPQAVDGSTKTMQIENCKKHGIENFIMACIFLFTTVLALKKLGFTTSDFDFSASGGGGNGSYPSWIHVFEKSSVVEEEAIIKVPAATKEPEAEPSVAAAADETLAEETVATEEDEEDEEAANEIYYNGASDAEAANEIYYNGASEAEAATVDEL